MQFYSANQMTGVYLKYNTGRKLFKWGYYIFQTISTMQTTAKDFTTIPFLMLCQPNYIERI